MLATQQITIHMMLFKCQQTNPGNVYKFNGNLALMNQKDMYPTDEIFAAIFHFSKTFSPIEHFESLGYEGSNFIEMTGSLLINLTIAIFTALVMKILYLVTIKNYQRPSMSRLGAKLSNNNTVAAIFMIYLQGYLEMLICCMISLSRIG